MITELISLTKYSTSSNPIILDDYLHRSFAAYHAKNDFNKSFIYCKPDEKGESAPRCDYLLVCSDDFTIRFIELKGNDKQEDKKCCKNVWGHAFHQLVATYDNYSPLIDHEKDIVKMILCTSAYRFSDSRRRSATRYEQYRYYKKIRELGVVPLILYCDDEDVV